MIQERFQQVYHKEKPKVYITVSNFLIKSEWVLYHIDIFRYDNELFLSLYSRVINTSLTHVQLQSQICAWLHSFLFYDDVFFYGPTNDDIIQNLEKLVQ